MQDWSAGSSDIRCPQLGFITRFRSNLLSTHWSQRDGRSPKVLDISPTTDGEVQAQEAPCYADWSTGGLAALGLIGANGSCPAEPEPCFFWLIPLAFAEEKEGKSSDSDEVPSEACGFPSPRLVRGKVF